MARAAGFQVPVACPASLSLRHDADLTALGLILGSVSGACADRAVLRALGCSAAQSVHEEWLLAHIHVRVASERFHPGFDKQGWVIKFDADGLDRRS